MIIDFWLYSLAFLSALGFSLGLTPLMGFLAKRWGVLDRPTTAVKTHQEPTPYLGGVAIFGAILVTLFLLRFLTHFPTGTLHSMRALLVGGFFMVLVGVVDDVKSGGLRFQWKFLLQILAAWVLILFDVRIQFVQPVWLAQVLTILWVVGITNAFNIIDIMDGLSSSQAFVASLGFLFISLPTEAIYVNFTAAAVAGACLGFIPYNLSHRFKIFMGDAGSLLLGFLLASLSLGTSYTQVAEVGLFAPFLILGLPLYDTFFVSILRIKQGRSPFLGSKDHLALKLKALGLGPRQVVFWLGVVAAGFSGSAYWLTVSPPYAAVVLVGFVVVVGLYGILKLHPVQVP
jgi:UDP-GlcNAc:undecaprenyl-phosphate GlcNAc-1-phosphate transferase